MSHLPKNGSKAEARQRRAEIGVKLWSIEIISPKTKNSFTLESFHRSSETCKDPKLKALYLVSLLRRTSGPQFHHRQIKEYVGQRQAT
jgi:hypothetical protein